MEQFDKCYVHHHNFLITFLLTLSLFLSYNITVLFTYDQFIFTMGLFIHENDVSSLVTFVLISHVVDNGNFNIILLFHSKFECNFTYI